MKITACTIGPYPKSFFDPMPMIHVKFEDGSEKDLFEFYPDEISFNSSEFIGLTEEQARHLKFKKDRDYLKS
jgi:hypothetical protein